MTYKETPEEAAIRAAVEQMFCPQENLKQDDMITFTRIFQDANAALYLLYIINKISVPNAPFSIDKRSLKDRFGFSISRQNRIIEKLISMCMLNKVNDLYTLEVERIESYVSNVID